MAVLDQFGQPFLAPAQSIDRTAFYQTLKARYDSAQTTEQNERHWANADYLSPTASNTPEIRRRIRSRARYESENNSYAKGMFLTLANDLIGTGPRLQLLTPDRAGNSRVERTFGRWARRINLPAKLRTLRVAKAVDGELFALLTMGGGSAQDITLDIQPFEADYVDQPQAMNGMSTGTAGGAELDGIQLDDQGNIKAYYILKDHPGDALYYGGQQGTWISADRVLHLYREDRPGQRRGMSEIVTALPLFAMLRRFTLATLAAAETAAGFAAVMHTNSGAITEVANLPQDQWFATAIPLEHRAMLTLPNGWTMTQLKPEHPATTYEMFKKEIINELARCLNMPFNIAAANSASYNYASGRMDHQVYYRAIAVEQSQWESAILDRIFRAWLDEAALIPGLLPEVGVPIAEWDWRWFWDGPTHVDPSKEANAQATRLQSLTTTLADEFAREGKDWEQQLQQRGRELALMRQLGIGQESGQRSAVSDQPEEEEARNSDS